MSSEPTAAQVAAWMLNQVETGDTLYQDVAVAEIAETFGERFTYINGNGNQAIGKDVLKAFARISGDAVVWERGERYWRKREQFDEPGRQQS